MTAPPSDPSRSLAAISLRPSQALSLTPEFLARYAVEAELGHGTSGVVVRASDLSLGRPVAIKFLHADGHPLVLQRFQQEARLLASLSHPNVVKLFDSGYVETTPYMVLELIDGGSVRDLILEDGPVPVAEAVRIARACLAGLAVCHQAGIVHRDVKPENLLLTRDGEPKLADLGVALLEHTSQRLTVTGGLVGTVLYMAPEQVVAGDITPASDLYAVAGTLYHMLAGRPPFKARTLAELLRLVADVEPADVRTLRPEVPERLARVLQRALAKDPHARPASADALSAQLEESLEPAHARAAERTAPRAAERTAPRPAARASRMRNVAAGAVALALSAVAGALLVRGRVSPVPPVSTGSPGAPGPTSPAPSGIVAAQTGSPWSDAAALRIESELAAVAVQQPAHQRAWNTMHRTLGMRAPEQSGPKHPYGALHRAINTEVKALGSIAWELDALPSRAQASPLEEILRTRLLAHQWITEAVQRRFRQYGALTLDAELHSDASEIIALDATPLEGPGPAHFIAFCTRYPHALDLAASAGSAAGERPGALLLDLAAAVHWFDAFSGSVRATPGLVAALDRLEKALAGDSPDTVEGRTHAVAEAVLRWKRAGARAAPVRADLETALPLFRALGVELPGSRAALESLAADIRAELDAHRR